VARHFDGANDRIQNTPLNSVLAIDSATMTIALWMRLTAGDPAGVETVIVTADGLVSGQSAAVLQVDAPATAGWLPQFAYRWSGAIGTWEADTDIAITTTDWIHYCVTYDRGSTGNNPIIYIDGSSVAFTEDITPSGTARSDVDNIRLGEDAGSATDWEGDLGEVSFWDVILTADEVGALARGVRADGIRRANLRWWTPLEGNDEPEREWAQHGELAVTGTTKSTSHPPIAMGRFWVRQTVHEGDEPPAPATEENIVVSVINT
jgi:hypothetical protein